MKLNGIKNKVQTITYLNDRGEKSIYKIRVPKLQFKPSFHDIEQYAILKGLKLTKKELIKRTCKALLKSYQYNEVILEKGDKINEVKTRIEKLELYGLTIIRGSKMQVLDYVFLDRNKQFYINHFTRLNKNIVLGYKRHNATSKFKLAMSLGSERVKRFNLFARCIKDVK
ncbi:MAG: hypothetical protein ACRCYT_04925 [Cetobacterium sp.]